MSERENRREKILSAAAELFMQHGYHETSVRRIAQEVGCTEAALYYHFKAGKRELLQEVIGAAEVDLRASVENIQASASRRDLIERYGSQLIVMRGGRVQKTLRWISHELPRLSAEERETFYRPLLQFHSDVYAVARRFIDDPAEADVFTWLLICTGFGFRQIFFDMELGSRVDVDVTRLYHLLAESLSSS